MKNRLIKKLIIGYSGKKSFLAKCFRKKYKKKYEFKCYSGNINHHLKFFKWIQKNSDLNIFINFAAITDPNKCFKHKSKAVRTNYESPKKIIDIINKANLKKFNYFLFLSSSHVFKNSFNKLNENSLKKPKNFYGHTKLLFEKYILSNKKKLNFDIGVARIFNYYNENRSKNFFINDVRRKLNSKNKEIKFNNVNTYRDFISIKNINSALFHMIDNKLKGDFNICSGKKIYLPDIINFLNSKKNKTITFDKKKLPGLVGSNSKLKKTGWINKNTNLFNELHK